VIAGEDRDQRMIDARHHLALHGGEPGNNLLEPPERSGRLGQLAVARRDRGDSGGIGRLHQFQEIADIVEGQARIRHGRAMA